MHSFCVLCELHVDCGHCKMLYFRECIMKNQQIAKIFNEIAELLELKGENVFRVRA